MRKCNCRYDANVWLRETYMAEHNARFAIAAEQEGSAFVADATGAWREILCIQEDRTVGNDNTVTWQRLSLRSRMTALTLSWVDSNTRCRVRSEMAFASAIVAGDRLGSPRFASM